MALRSMTLPDLVEGRSFGLWFGLWLDLRTPSCFLSNSGFYQGQWHPSQSSIPHEVAAGRLLVGEGLRAAQASLVPLHQVPDSRAAGAALSREGPGLRRRVGHAGSELQLQFHMLAQLGWRDTGQHSHSASRPQASSQIIFPLVRPMLDLNSTLPLPGFIVPHIVEASGPATSYAGRHSTLPTTPPSPSAAHLKKPRP